MERTYRWTGVDPVVVQKNLYEYCYAEELQMLGPLTVRIMTNLDNEGRVA